MLLGAPSSPPPSQRINWLDSNHFKQVIQAVIVVMIVVWPNTQDAGCWCHLLAKISSHLCLVNKRYIYRKVLYQISVQSEWRQPPALRVLKPIRAIFGLIANKIDSFGTNQVDNCLLALEKVAIKSSVSSADHRWRWWIQPITLLHFA